ncbi:hypothetical protein PIB30_054246 [Stylosanthes scabra]|uniref:Uncharacterized protein n=1 Tax=Stylosanthes scabra TaxID=79078 RepID=A0ABU6ZHF8_9FABA|nr:hypothetical protein [Stylosanthes scabra]
MQGRLKFEESKPEMKFDSDPFEVNSSYVEPCCFGVNMVGFASFEFDTSLGDFEKNIRQVFLGVGEGCSSFEKEKMKKELAHKEEQVRQRYGPRRTEASSSMNAQVNSDFPIAMRWMREVQKIKIEKLENIMSIGLDVISEVVEVELVVEEGLMVDSVQIGVGLDSVLIEV